tara:strand:+ start:4491 stop:5786 length:1296 start_codon:yes stop_codon:yes gene_type:complete
MDFKNLIRIIVLCSIGCFLLIVSGCIPPDDSSDDDSAEAEAARLDSLRTIKCPRLLSSSAEYYKNKDWESTVLVYKQLVNLGCDKGNEEDVFQYWAVAYEYLGKFDSSEYAILQGLKRLPESIELRKRLAYAYNRLGDKNKELLEYERLMDMVTDDVKILKRLAGLYSEMERYEDQIYILQKILVLEPNNKDAQGDLANVFEKTGRDPLDIYRQRFESNSENLSFGIDLVDQLTAIEQYDEAITILNRLLSSNPSHKTVSMKLVLIKLANVYYKTDQLDKCADSYEQLYEFDKRDFKTAVKIAKVKVEESKFNDALEWADKAIRIAPDNGETFGCKGYVYYNLFKECRSDYPSADDKVIASLAYKYFKLSEEKNYNRYRRDQKWLEENEVLFSKSDWFMLNPEKKTGRKLLASGPCYEIVTESLQAESDWD